MKGTTVIPPSQRSVEALEETRRFRRMLEEFDLAGIMANERILDALTDLCTRELRKQFDGDNFVWVDVHGYPFSKALAVQLGLRLADNGQWLAIPCYEVSPYDGGDLWQNIPTMIRISKLGEFPSEMPDGLQAFRPCAGWQPWW